MNLKEQCLKDEMMSEFYDELIKNQTPMTYREMIVNIRFFIIFSMGCRRIGINEVADKMTWRLNILISMLKEKGYRAGSRHSKSKEYGFDDILSRAFAINYEKLWE